MCSITPEQMDKIDTNSAKLGVSRLLLMENAGSAIAQYIVNQFKELKNKKIVIVAGTGNNGGDSFVAARHLAHYNAKIVVILLGSEVKTKEALLNWNGINNMIKSIEIKKINDISFKDGLKLNILEADIVIDAIFGTGIRGILREPHSKAIDLINESKAFILSVDVPSGLDPLTGDIHEKSVLADTTITFHRYKIGLINRADITGKLELVSIGVPPEAEDDVIS